MGLFHRKQTPPTGPTPTPPNGSDDDDPGWYGESWKWEPGDLDDAPDAR